MSAEIEHRADLVDRKGKLVWVCSCGSESEPVEVERRDNDWNCGE